MPDHYLIYSVALYTLHLDFSRGAFGISDLGVFLTGALWNVSRLASCGRSPREIIYFDALWNVPGVGCLFVPLFLVALRTCFYGSKSSFGLSDLLSC